MSMAASRACSEIVDGGSVLDRVAPTPRASKVVLLKIPSKKGVCHPRHTSPGWSPAASHKRSGPSPLCLKSIVAPAVTSLICFASLVATSPRLVASVTSTALGHKLVSRQRCGSGHHTDRPDRDLRQLGHEPDRHRRVLAAALPGPLRSFASEP